MQLTREETILISEIAKRAGTYCLKNGINYNHLTTVMDIQNVHEKDCPLNLMELLNAKWSDFLHDVFGISKYIDREKGILTDCFLPRYAFKKT